MSFQRFAIVCLVALAAIGGSATGGGGAVRIFWNSGGTYPMSGS